MTSEHREYVKKRLVEISEGIATTMRGNCVVDIEESYPCLYNHVELVDMFINKAKDVIGESKVITLEKPSMGVESFAYFSIERPALFYFLGSKNEEKGIIHPAHGCYFDVDEDCLPIGVALQCEMALELLNRL